jgi:hypothetical protein
MTTLHAIARETPPGGAREYRHVVKWVVAALVAAAVSYFAFRSYLDPTQLLQFTHPLHC